jgi:hypothetical protein
MAKISPAEFAEKWQRRLTAATEDIRRGVERVNEAPTAKAAAKKDKMLARLMEAVQSGKWENGLKKIPLEEWKEKMIDIGINRIPQGASANVGKVQDFANQILPYIDAGLQQIQKMPDITLEDSVNRMVAWIRHMAKFQKK